MTTTKSNKTIPFTTEIIKVQPYKQKGRNRFHYGNDIIDSTINKFQKCFEQKQVFLDYLKSNPKANVQFSESVIWHIKNCGNVVKFGVNYKTGMTKLVYANFCKHDKVCPICATRRAIKMMQQFHAFVDEKWLRQKKWYYAVLTIKHNKGDSLSELLGKLMAYREEVRVRFNKAHKKKWFASFFSKVDGFVSSIEITNGSDEMAMQQDGTYIAKNGYERKEDNGRHPHLNILFCTDNEIPCTRVPRKEKSWYFYNNDLKQEWWDITQDSFVTYLRPIEIKDGDISIDGIWEVFKYVLKFWGMSPRSLATILYLQKKNRYRFLSSVWCLYHWSKAKKPIREIDMHEADDIVYELDKTLWEYITDGIND